MDRQTALLVLQLPDSPTHQETCDALENHVFQLRDFLFKQTVIPQVYRAKVDRLVAASEVGETLGIELTEPIAGIPELAPLDGTADAMVRQHADNVGRLRTAMASTLNPSCLSRLGECLVRIQQQYQSKMMAWSSERMLDDAQVLAMREEWSPAEFANALEQERKGDLIDSQTNARLNAELLRIRTLCQKAIPA